MRLYDISRRAGYRLGFPVGVWIAVRLEHLMAVLERPFLPWLERRIERHRKDDR